MDRGLDGYIFARLLAGCVVVRVRGGRGLAAFPVALAWGKHLFPFRTEQLSPTAPMVLGLQGPGRVGRRRFLHSSRPPGRLDLFLGSRAPRRRSRPPRPGAGGRVSASRRAEVSGRAGTAASIAGEPRGGAGASVIPRHRGSMTIKGPPGTECDVAGGSARSVLATRAAGTGRVAVGIGGPGAACRECGGGVGRHRARKAILAQRGEVQR